MIELLNADGAHVVVIHPIPKLPGRSARLRRADDPGQVLQRQRSDRSFADRERRLAVAAERGAVAAAASATAFGFDDELCEAYALLGRACRHVDIPATSAT